MQIGFQERDNINKKETKEKKKVSIHNFRARFIWENLRRERGGGGGGGGGGWGVGAGA